MSDQSDQLHALSPRTGRGHYGHQPARVVFAAGQGGQQLLCEQVSNPEYLWRVQASGTNVTFALTWGTRATQRLIRLRSPLVVLVPGAFMLECEQVDLGLPSVALATLTAATGGIETVRTVVGPGPVVLPETARRVTALVAGTIVTIDGAAVPLALGASLDVASLTVITAGRVLVEHAV